MPNEGYQFPPGKHPPTHSCSEDEVASQCLALELMARRPHSCRILAHGPHADSRHCILEGPGIELLRERISEMVGSAGLDEPDASLSLLWLLGDHVMDQSERRALSTPEVTHCK